MITEGDIDRGSITHVGYEEDEAHLNINQAHQAVKGVLHEKYSRNITNNLGKSSKEFIPLPVKDLEKMSFPLQENHKEVQFIAQKYNDQISNSSEYFTDLTTGNIQSLQLEETELKNEKRQHPAGAACEQLHNTDFVQTKKIVMTEKIIRQDVTDKIRRFYNTILMEGKLSIPPVSPSKLTKINTELIDRLLAANKDSIGKSEPDLNDNLHSVLTSDFELIKIKNLETIIRHKKIIENLITKHKKRYCDDMEIATREKKNLQDLQVMHKQTLEKVSSQLDMDITEQIGAVSCEMYLQTLATHIEKYWINFQRLSTLDFCQPQPNLDGGITRTKNWEQSSSYIIFQLSLTKIGVAVSDQETIIQKYNHFEIKSAIGVTHENKWLYGIEVFENMTSCRKVWKLEKYLTDYEEPSKPEKEKYNGAFHEVTAKFVIGMLLHFLKRKVEERHSVYFPKTILVIPFWFTSYHRQQIVEAGMFAGFLETHLIDENVAIAVNAYRLTAPKMEESNANVLTEVQENFKSNYNEMKQLQGSFRSNESNMETISKHAEPTSEQKSSKTTEERTNKKTSKNRRKTVLDHLTSFLSTLKETSSNSNQEESTENAPKKSGSIAEDINLGNVTNDIESTKLKHKCVDHYVFVICENSGHVDATLFKIKKADDNRRYLKIVSHSEYYDEESREENRQVGVNDACLKAEMECNNINTKKYVCISVESFCWILTLSVGKIHLSRSSLVGKGDWSKMLAMYGAGLYINGNKCIQISQQMIAPNFTPPFNPEHSHQPYHDDYEKAKGIHVRSKQFKRIEKKVLQTDISTSSPKIDLCFVSSKIKMSPNCCSFEVFINHHGSLLGSDELKLESEVKQTEIQISVPEISTKSNNKACKKLVGKFEILQKKVENGECSFHSELIKEMVLQQILESVEILKSSNDDSVIEMQTTIHSAMILKYFPTVQG